MLRLKNKVPKDRVIEMCDTDVDVSQYRIRMCGMGDTTRKAKGKMAVRLQEMFYEVSGADPKHTWLVTLDPVGSKNPCNGDRK